MSSDKFKIGDIVKSIDSGYTYTVCSDEYSDGRYFLEYQNQVYGEKYPYILHKDKFTLCKSSVTDNVDRQPQVGDVYVKINDDDHFWTIESGPDVHGWCFATKHYGNPDSQISTNSHKTVIMPSSSHYRFKPKRPLFPQREYRNITVDENGNINRADVVVYCDYKDIPWRWVDGTLVTKEEMNP